MIAGQVAGRLCPNPLTRVATEAVLVIHISDLPWIHYSQSVP